MIEKIGNVFYRVQDMDRAVAFYREVLGLGLKFRDGSSWAAFDVSGTTFALDGSASTNEPSGGATVSFKVTDLAAAVTHLRGQGIEVTDVRAGPHEDLAEFRDPSGNLVVLYTPRREST